MFNLNKTRLKPVHSLYKSYTYVYVLDHIQLVISLHIFVCFTIYSLHIDSYIS